MKDAICKLYHINSDYNCINKEYTNKMEVSLIIGLKTFTEIRVIGG